MPIESNNYINENTQSDSTDSQIPYKPSNELSEIHESEQIDDLKENLKDYIFWLNIELNWMTHEEINKEISQKVSIFLDSQGDYIQSLPKEEKNKIILNFLEFWNDLKIKFDDWIITTNEIDEVLNNFITRS